MTYATKCTSEQVFLIGAHLETSELSFPLFGISRFSCVANVAAPAFGPVHVHTHGTRPVIRREQRPSAPAIPSPSASASPTIASTSTSTSTSPSTWPWCLAPVAHTTECEICVVTVRIWTRPVAIPPTIGGWGRAPITRGRASSTLLKHSVRLKYDGPKRPRVGTPNLQRNHHSGR
eukprot:9498096-Pyramimonas_sp.AAC.1